MTRGGEERWYHKQKNEGSHPLGDNGSLIFVLRTVDRIFRGNYLLEEIRSFFQQISDLMLPGERKDEDLGHV